MNKTILLTITFTHNSVFNNREDDDESKRSDNKNNDYSKNNDLKDGRNDRLGKKQALIRTGNWSDLYAFEKYKH